MRRTLLVALKLSLILVFLAPLTAQAGQYVLHPKIMHEMNALLRASDMLHVALIRNDEEFLEVGARDLFTQIEKTWATSAIAKDHERYHLLKVLDACRDALEQAQSVRGEERVNQYKVVFNQLVNLVRVYKLDPRYSIFFCDHDKTSWVQKGMHGLDPFSANHQCGIRVPPN